ncbi:MAG TPA: UvrB/UvrC motif-containing protein [Planctomycetota bacterium]|jgi:hypothetical protein
MDEATDLRDILESWPFDASKDSRYVKLPDGRTVLQVRLPLGVEQYELEGRPDGHRFHGKESVLDFHLQRFATAKAAGKAEKFALTPPECAELFDEGTLYYLRYLHLFELHDWPRTVRDTGRNLKLFDFVGDHAERDEDRQNLEKWRPYVLRMNAIAQSMIELEAEDFAGALHTLQTAVNKIEGLAELDDDTFRFEKMRSVGALRELLDQVKRNKPLTEMERLERDLQRAVDREQFERAAQLRDRIKDLRKDSGQ